MSSFAGDYLSSSPESEPSCQSLLRRDGLFANLGVLRCSRDLRGLGNLSFSTHRLFFSSLLTARPAVSGGFLTCGILPLLEARVVAGGTRLAAGTVILFFASTSGLSQRSCKFLILPIVGLLFSGSSERVHLTLLSSLSIITTGIRNTFVRRTMCRGCTSKFASSSPKVHRTALGTSVFLTPGLSSHRLGNRLLQFCTQLRTSPRPKVETGATVYLKCITGCLSTSAEDGVLKVTLIGALDSPFKPTEGTNLSRVTGYIRCFSPESLTGDVLPLVIPVVVSSSRRVGDGTLRLILSLMRGVEAFTAASTPLESRRRAISSRFGLSRPSHQPDLRLRPAEDASADSQALSRYVTPNTGGVSSSSPELRTGRSERGNKGISALPKTSTSVYDERPRDGLIIEASEPVILQGRQFNSRGPRSYWRLALAIGPRGFRL